MRTRSIVVLALVAASSLLAGCTGGGESAAAPAPTTTVAATSPATATSASATAGATATSGLGCAPVGSGIPADAASAPTLDVDGDGRADTAWLEGNTSSAVVVVGVTTASGATFSADYSSASPVSRQMLIADVDEAGTIAAIVSDGRTASLYSVSGCAIVPALNVQGSQYTFDLTGTGGSGVGCSQVAGEPGRELVGLMLNQDPDGQPVSITRTAVLLDGAEATNGPSDTVDVAGDPTGPAVTSATRVSCGELISTVHASS